MFYSEEYRHLLTAERVLAQILERPDACDAGEAAQVARAIVAVVQQKRVHRMKPSPKPVDVTIRRKKTRPALQDDLEDPDAGVPAIPAPSPSPLVPGSTENPA